MYATMITILILLLLPLSQASMGAGISIPGGLSHEKLTSAGETYHGIIQINNTLGETQQVRIYRTDYLFYSDGRSLYGAPGSTERSNAAWIRFSPGHMSIPPHEVAELHYTISVPDDDSLTGTFWSMLMVEGVSVADPEDTDPMTAETSIRLKQLIRYGIQMVSHVGPGGERGLSFLSPRLIKDADGRFLHVAVENSGQRMLRPSLWAELYNEEGVYVGTFDGGKYRTYPGTSVRYTIDLSDAPRGNYKALVVADCGGEAVFGVTYTLKLEQ